MTRRIVVTGGAGFIGSHLVDRLLEDEDANVLVLDDFFTGSRRNLQQSLRRHPDRLEVERHDVCEPFHVECDEVYHLACPASPVHYQRNPARTIDTAILGTRNALECARRASDAAMVLASTSEVYGDPAEHPQSEDYRGNANPVGPRACYDEGKRASEAMCVAWAKQHAVNVGIARIFNTYGPRMARDDGRLLPNLICQALEGRELTVYGSGEQTRSFCYVSDTVGGLVRLMSYTRLLRGMTPSPFNIGNPDERSVNDVAWLVAGLAGVPLDISREDLPEDDPCRRKPDIFKAKSFLNWEPRVSFGDGLVKTYDWFKRGDAPDAMEVREARWVG